LLRDFNISSEDVLRDLKCAKPVKRIKVGALCTYYENIFSCNIIPNNCVAWVFKKIKITKRKMVDKSRTGYVKKVKYTISETYRYYVILKLLDHRTITIPCQKEDSADDIVEFYANNSNAIVGAGEANRKKYGKRIAAYKKSHKK
jgi:hypothetical protein